jgi:transposase-like protein
VESIVPPERGEQGKWLPMPQTRERAELILKRYESGEMVRDVAKELGITHQAAYQSLIKYCQDDWRDSQAARSLTEYEKAKAKLQAIWEMPKAERDAIALACAREELRSAQWGLERLLPRLYAQKQEVKVDVNVNLSDRLTRARERVINNDAAQLPHSSTGIMDSVRNVIDATIVTEQVDTQGK